MKIFKFIIIITISLVLISALILRIKKINNEGFIRTTLSGLQEGDEFVVAAYYPITKQVNLNDSSIFYPGKFLVQEEVKVKHRFFLFSSYLEKSPSNAKYFSYQSIKNPIKSQFIILPNRYDTTFRRETYVKKQEDFEPHSLLDSYEIEGSILDTHNKEFAMEEFEKLDTIKFFIKKAHINFSAEGDFYRYELTLEREPLDSVLYVRNHKITVPNNI